VQQPEGERPDQEYDERRERHEHRFHGRESNGASGT
jgi:hypothetical protein